MDADTLASSLKIPGRNGTTHLLLSPLELIEKLAPLGPPPRLNLVRYHGVRKVIAARTEPHTDGCESGGR